MFRGNGNKVDFAAKELIIVPGSDVASKPGETAGGGFVFEK
jgi:hypothetical protein